MNTLITAPYYLATNRGFYSGSLVYGLQTNDAVVFTSNVRRATPFSSYDEAEHIFTLLLHDSFNPLRDVGCYCAILATPNTLITNGR